jgi:hypothetical protein
MKQLKRDGMRVIIIIDKAQARDGDHGAKRMEQRAKKRGLRYRGARVYP